MGWLVGLLVLQPVPPPDVVVTAAAPLDSQRLADALRVYLGDTGARVETAGNGPATGDLRAQLAEARRAGEAVRAVAVVRAEAGTGGAIEIELVDLTTEKALVTSVPRPARDEDLYRTLALKIRALLRSTLSESPERLSPRSAVARLVEPMGIGSPSAGPSPATIGRPGLEAGYAARRPLSGPALRGLSVTGVLPLRPFRDTAIGLEVAVTLSDLSAPRIQQGDVLASASMVPVEVSLRVRRAWSRFELLAGPSAEVAVVNVSVSSATTPVQSSRDLSVALGAELEGRARWGGTFFAFVRPVAQAVLLGNRYAIEGQPVLDTARLALAVTVGIGLGTP